MPPLQSSKQGFFFTAMALALLSFMLLFSQAWVRTFEQQDLRAAQRFRGDAVQQILSVASDQSLSEFANASGFFATYRLAEYASTSAGALPPAISDDPANPGTGTAEAALRELMANGTLPSQLTGFTPYTEEERGAYTISSWLARMRTSAGVMGFDLAFSEPKNFSVRQAGPWMVQVHFEIAMNISDKEGTMFQNRNLTAETNFTIGGFADPLVRRRSAEEGHANVGRQVFRSPGYQTPADVSPNFAAGSRGAGWFFGAVRESYPNPNDNVSGLSQSVLVRSYDDNLISYMDLFGAVVVTSEPKMVTNETEISGCRFRVENETRCINCRVRFVPLDDKNASKPQCSTLPTPERFIYNRYDKPYVAGTGAPPLQDVERPTPQSYVLIDNWNEREDPLETRGLGRDPDFYHRAWNITSMRDMAICGLYVASPVAPSFFQRMVAGSGLASAAYGIESFVIGRWAGGAEDAGNDGRSRLDWEFYSGQTGDRVKGMMGCKTPEMCSGTAAVQESVGHFAITPASSARYGMGQISCGATGLHASC